MTDTIFYSCFDSPIGSIYVAKSKKGICFVNLPKISEAGFISLLRKKFQKDVIRNDRELRIVINELLAFFNGSKVDFKSLLDLNKGTIFQRKVWNKISEIPYGELEHINGLQAESVTHVQ